MRNLPRAVAPLVLLTALAAPRAAYAQLDLSGEWGTTFFEDILHRGATLVPGDNTGVPLSEAGRRKAESWDESVVATHERQCIPHPVTYAVRGPGNIRMVKVVDEPTGRLVGYSLQGSYVGHFRTIWLDGRPHPSELAPHSYTGFPPASGSATPRRQDDAHEDGLSRSQRDGEQRTGDDDGALRPTGSSDGRHLHSRPGVSERAVHPQHGLHPQLQRQCRAWARAGRIKSSMSSSIARRLCAASSAGHRRSGTRAVPVKPSCPVGGRERRHRHDLSDTPRGCVSWRARPDSDEHGRSGLWRNRCIAPRPRRLVGEGHEMQGRVYMISGAGGNIAAQIGDDGVVL